MSIYIIAFLPAIHTTCPGTGATILVFNSVSILLLHFGILYPVPLKSWCYVFFYFTLSVISRLLPVPPMLLPVQEDPVKYPSRITLKYRNCIFAPSTSSCSHKLKLCHPIDLSMLTMFGYNCKLRQEVSC